MGSLYLPVIRLRQSPAMALGDQRQRLRLRESPSLGLPTHSLTVLSSPSRGSNSTCLMNEFEVSEWAHLIIAN